ncbi:glutamate 5-kinase [Clostridiaceae bacterium UIB06]|uniref:Glutamate 5-kinase n=1 Tax=Clostridium thailandense TaxID=2794346 RepID=A0A949TP98_9CLOT|nr:glutamate 5-kinase [Clostridium thailandense]MBV7276045.1 glutamate 5-kinase [Clostridium thailandense]MCH5136995.1 glutamate 5-kinase [Clostridiaceae bacterium UIB06]
MDIRSKYLKNVKRVVVKIGSSTLTHSSGFLNLSRIEKLVRQISDLHNQGIEIVLVSSGAIAAGIGKLGLKNKPATIPEKQAAAAIGQGILLHMYEKMFSEYGKIAAQILITREDVSNRTRFLNARNTFFSLFEKGVITIVNENDAIVVDEIKFGDNDTLSAIVASLVEADLLILLSDIEGLYDSDPRTNPQAKLIHEVERITEEVERSAGGAGTSLGTGGMATKISAAKIATSAGVSMVIVNGANEGIINDVVNLERVGTFFVPDESPMHLRKHWLTFNTDIKGKLVVDNGAYKALVNEHKSLLPSGIVSVEGFFNHGQIVSIITSDGVEIGRGITNYDSSEIEQIKSLKTDEIEGILGYKNYDEIVHCNNMAIF